MFINQTKSRVFKDLDLNFSIHPITKDISKTNNAKAIKDALKRLVLMNPYDKPFNPNIGGGVSGSLYKLNDPLSRSRLRTRIEDTIKNHEPRVRLESVFVESTFQNKVKIDILFEIVGLPGRQEFSVILERTR